MEKYLLYLNLDSKLPSFYYLMAKNFAQQGVTVLPITIEQLPHFIKQSEMNYIICPTMKMDHLKKFEERLQRIFKNGLNNNILTVYHLSSFAKINMAKTNQVSKNYYMLQLPVATEVLVKYLSKHFMINKNKKLIWPGGKRSTLPQAS